MNNFLSDTTKYVNKALKYSDMSAGLANKIRTGTIIANKNIKVALSDPMGSALYSHIKNNKLESSGNSITEGIGSSRVTKNFENAKIDGAFSINDYEALPILYDLIENEGLSLGTSCGINIAGAIRLGKELGPGKTIVTILCDNCLLYTSPSPRDRQKSRMPSSA